MPQRPRKPPAQPTGKGRKGPDIRTCLEALRTRCEEADLAGLKAAVREALADPHRLLVARAAELAGERLLYGLEPDLVAAYARFLDDPVGRDPGCTAKGAVARALVALDSQDAAFFIAGLAYRQHEAAWGGSTDTAVDLRGTCAIGLAATGHPRAPIHLVDLLYDPEPHCRAAAARALACTQPLAAEAVLRVKALAGDAEAEVTGECLAGVLAVAAEDGLDFVTGFLDRPDPDLAGLAALALGESHLEGALDALKSRWDAEPFKGARERALLRAAALHRSPAALDWLVDVAGRADRASTAAALGELAAFRRNGRLRERLAATLAERDDPELLARFERAFSDAP